MSPLSFWIAICIGSVIYHFVKYTAFGSFDAEELFVGIYWTGICMAAVHYEWVKS